MGQKDPKDMTVSELLRWTANYANITCRACQEMGFGCDDANDCDCDNAWGFIADKIDAELAQARELSLLRGAELWAKDNGWPDFKDGEDFGAWLDRCAYKKPVDDCNEPVQFGDEIELHFSGGGMENGRFQEVTVNRGPVWMLSFTGVDHERLYRYDSECDVLKRPAPEALGADGKPIVVGETVWGILSGSKGIVNSLNDESTAYVEWDDGRWSPCIDCCNLTHTPPDTQERIDGDVTGDPCNYWGHDKGGCKGCPGFGNGGSCVESMVHDLLRRQRELNKRTGGAE